MENVSWQDKYIDKLSNDMDRLSRDMDALKGMEARIISHVDNRINHMDSQRASEMRELMTSIADTSKHVQSVVIAAMMGMGAVMIGIGAIAVAVWLK